MITDAKIILFLFQIKDYTLIFKNQGILFDSSSQKKAILLKSSFHYVPCIGNECSMRAQCSIPLNKDPSLNKLQKFGQVVFE